ncbi:MAG: SUF system NifU family Fe-S cluster assembly protein [Gallionellales bacterium RIFCSPHIGHO2_02_FULL_57_16]|nr:MAG: SUF system NifU family Fe-S cluster assembly protein [Gallionellales bacterium RIFCSPHIGHO2_02_FULL_57_16]
MTDIRQLYQEVILDHNRKPRNFGSILGANRHAEGHNPLCGDHIRLSMNVLEDKIETIAFEGEGCAICKASASMMTGAVKGKSVQDAEIMVEEFRGMATGTLDLDRADHHLGKLKIFAGVKDLPSRVKCAILPWHTLHAALHPVLSPVEGAEFSVSTEGEADPVPGTGIGEE